MTPINDSKLANAASVRLDQLADEVQRYHPHLTNAGFDLALAGPLTDTLIAHSLMIKALDRLPNETRIAYEMSEADARLIQRVLRACADDCLTKLEAATLNLKIREAGRMDDVQNAFRQSKHGCDQASRDVGQSSLISATGRHWRAARNWVKSSIDRFSATPARKF